METVGREMPIGAGFNALPEGCIANILSLTTPSDACRLSLVSSIFRSAAESDDVWGRFLPSDYRSIISRSDLTTPPDPCRLSLGAAAESDGVWGRFLPSDYHSIISRFDGSSPSVTPLKKKQLFFRLCDTPLLIDGGNKSFSLDKWTGKKCYMIAARELSIAWGDTPLYWSWESLPQSRFAEVAVLRNVCWLEIRGKINTGMLSPETPYAAYLVCKFTNAYGFDDTPFDVSVGIVGGESCTRTVFLNISEEQRWPHFRLFRSNLVHAIASAAHQRLALALALALQPSMPSERGDGWLEIELGEYFNEGEADEELEMSLIEVKHLDGKSGLIIQGIEIRPKRG